MDRKVSLIERVNLTTATNPIDVGDSIVYIGDKLIGQEHAGD